MRGLLRPFWAAGLASFHSAAFSAELSGTFRAVAIRKMFLLSNEGICTKMAFFAGADPFEKPKWKTKTDKMQ